MTLTDHDETSLRFAGYNAFLNAAPIWALTVLDWHRPSIVARFDRVYAADVLYQISDHDSLLRCVGSLLSKDGFALIADPGRGVADHELQAVVELENHSLAAPGDSADGATEEQGRPGLGDAVGDVRAGEVHRGDFSTGEIRAELGDDGLNFGQFRHGESSWVGCATAVSAVLVTRAGLRETIRSGVMRTNLWSLRLGDEKEERGS